MVKIPKWLEAYADSDRFNKVPAWMALFVMDSAFDLIRGNVAAFCEKVLLLIRLVLMSACPNRCWIDKARPAIIHAYYLIGFLDLRILVDLQSVCSQSDSLCFHPLLVNSLVAAVYNTLQVPND